MPAANDDDDVDTNNDDDERTSLGIQDINVDISQFFIDFMW